MFEFRSAELATASRVVLMDRQVPAPREVIRRPRARRGHGITHKTKEPSGRPRDALPKLA